jgi:two-component system CheB/CheR fusion protein
MTSDECVNCHNSHPLTPKNDWKLGDVRGVLEVRVPIDDQLERAQRDELYLLFIMMIVVMFIAIIVFFVERAMRRRANEKSNFQLDLLAESTNVGMWELDVTSKTMIVNNRWLGIIGYTSEEIKGVDIIEWKLAKIHPGDVLETAELLDKHMHGKTESYVSEYRIRHKKGHWVWIYDSGKFSDWSRFEERYIVGTSIDVTSRKMLEAEREQIAQELTQLINTANAPIFGIDIEGKVNEWNQSAVTITGFSKEDVMGRVFEDYIIMDEHKESVKQVLDKALQGIETSNYEFPLHAKDGKRLEILLNATSRRDVEGNITGVIGIGQDITELRAKESALNQAQKMEAVGQLTGGIAHDFNNLLSIIKGNLRFLQEDIGQSTVEIDELFEDAMSAVDAGAELTQRMLAFSRTKTLQPEIKNANDTIEKFARFLSRTLAAGVELDIDLSDDALFINTDPSQLENALLNLSLNARDAMPEGGTITIGATQYHHGDGDGDTYSLSLREGDYVKISVTDTGSGISSEDLQHVYEPFFTTKEIGKGSGLGLSMVFGFTQQTNGACHIHSTPGQGTTVSMYFPEVIERRRVDRKTEDNEELPSLNSEVILVVEDEPRVRRVTLRDLKKLGYKTLEAENADMAKTIIESGKHIDLLFSDIIMPGVMDGRMLAVWIEEHYPQIKIILTSGFSKSAEEVDMEKVQTESFTIIGKPYSTAELAKQIKSMLAEDLL